MTFSEIIDGLMPFVNDASDMPCVIWKNNGEWGFNYFSIPDDDNSAGAYLDGVKTKDPYALMLIGRDYDLAGYSIVYDKVLSARLFAEYNTVPSDDPNREELCALANFLEDNMGELSQEVVDYIVSLDNPLAELGKMNPFSLISENSGLEYDADQGMEFLGLLDKAASGKQTLQNHLESGQFLKVENTDLSVILLKMHALGGSYMQDAQYNLNIIAQKKSSDYLLLMNGRNAYLTQAMRAYQRGTTPFNVWLTTEESPETRAYAIHIRDQWSAIIGDIVEVDLNKHQLDILQNSVCCSEVFAKLKDGSEKTFTADEWSGMDDIVRDRIESRTECFTSDGMHSVVRHLEELRKEHAATRKTVEPDVFLSDLNKQYMNAAPYPQPDMLRVYQTAAKDIMARGDATVYRLLPEGMKKLTPIDAVKYSSTLRCHGDTQFAVKKDSLEGIDKWAHREVDTLNAKREAERETFAKKFKLRGEEL